eukprot:TRINITY_DN2420_c0_g1_i2.p1 TRINITY_DN2420_c0_g1~~TRINITY_DN2420_c0_g1_i2.p1  ORF type:complete len:190 (-),score=69.48 TRINITY_DN2420_c0_g1_i2:136-645(-)
MYDQFQNVLKLGSLSKVMSMLPGFGAEFMTKGREEESIARIKRCITIMDSMNAQELDSDIKILTPQRIARIARGSGRSIRDVQEVIEIFKPFQKAASKLKGLKIPKNGDMSKMPRNMNMRQVASMFNPQMLQQMGGVNGLTSMMKQFSAAGGMPNMGNLAKMMGGMGGS